MNKSAVLLLIVVVLVSFGGYRYYAAAWLQAAHSSRDADCISNLRQLWVEARGYRELHGIVPKSWEDLPSETRKLKCPFGCEYQWVGSRLEMNGVDVLCMCPCHLESRPGWDLVRDPADFVLLANGGFEIVAHKDESTAFTICASARAE